jgi:uncharacterized protein (DUF4213/DUF364 family)
MQEQTKENNILKETAENIRRVLGVELDNLVVKRAVVGLFFSGVKLSNGFGGICFTPVKEIPEAVCCPSSARAMPNSGKLNDQPVSYYLDDLDHGGPLRKALSIAVLNALSETCWTKIPPKDYCIELYADPLDNIIISDDAAVVVIGALVPYIRMLRKRGQPFTILEKDPRVLKPEEMLYYVPQEKANEKISAADWLIITGTTLINNTLEDILIHCKPNAQIIVVGPTASMLPDAFFSRGVKSIGGIKVTHPDKLLDILVEAGSGYHFYGKSAERTVIKKQ